MQSQKAKKIGTVYAKNKKKIEPWVMAQLGMADQLYILLKQGTIKSVNTHFNWGRTLLHIAASANQPKVIDMLLKQGALVNRLDQDKLDPLDSALVNYSHESIQIFKKHGHFKRRPNPIDYGNADTFDLAERGRVFQLKKVKKANFNGQGLWKRTPLHWAAIYGHPKAFNYMLQNGAQQQQDIFGLKPIDYARLMQYNNLRIQLDLPLIPMNDFFPDL